MVELHAWITIRESYKNCDNSEVRIDEIVSIIREKTVGTIAAIKAINGEYFLVADASSNHLSTEYDEFFGLVKYICQVAKGSYGLVYLLNDEDKNGYDNEFCVYVIKQGKIELCKDSFLSPFVSEVEDKAEDINVSMNISNESVSRHSSPQEKIDLFRSMLKGRQDVYALRWYNTKTGKSGYSPVCQNKWRPGVCDMPKTKCTDCKYRNFAPLTDKALYDHLSGKDEFCRDVIGIYPMQSDETTYFLAIDFDDGDWQKDVSAVRDVCREYKICASVERSRSGNGAHIWIFFTDPISAVKARKLGSGLLTMAMKKRHEIKFDSYDRMFPNQDTMPSGGFGNLIALPLQKQAVKSGNSAFVDEDFIPYSDQWAYLSSITKLDESYVDDLLSTLCEKSDLGDLFTGDSDEKPWERTLITEEIGGFPKDIKVISSNQIYIPKDGFSQAALNKIKRLAAFKNPDFYKAQAIRMSTYNKPRIISLAQEDDKYIMLPRGCFEEFSYFAESHNCQIEICVKTIPGRKIDVDFNGKLHQDQQEAVISLTNSNNGVLAATTAFGKTVTAAAIISKLKVNTLILVHTQALLEQWKKSLTEFLSINEILLEQPKKRGRKKQLSVIGQLGGNKNTLNGIIDIATIQSLYNNGEVNRVIDNYGMVIVDECHHISAVSFEAVMREVKAKYVYGLTATPKRADGHEPIIFMQCGKIRYRTDAKDYAKKHGFGHILVPRFTKYRPDISNEKPTITYLYKDLSESEYRNRLISDDVISAVNSGRNPIVISERTSHLETLYEMLKEFADHVIILSGKGTVRAKKDILEKIKSIPGNESMIVLATGKYIGEGFDEPRLDTLFLTLPISWSGTLSQYAGRLHRKYEGKSKVMIYDYIDIHVPMLENMYKKRLRGYASLGYTLAEEASGEFKTIYTNDFEQDLFSDISNAKKSIVLAGSYISSRQLNKIITSAENAKLNNVLFKVITKKSDSIYSRKMQSVFTSHEIEFAVKNRLDHSLVIIDGKTVWYGSGELFSASEDDCVLRICDDALAGELIQSLL